jgi:hypothetical protein
VAELFVTGSASSQAPVRKAKHTTEERARGSSDSYGAQRMTSDLQGSRLDATLGRMTPPGDRAPALLDPFLELLNTRIQSLFDGLSDGGGLGEGSHDTPPARAQWQGARHCAPTQIVWVRDGDAQTGREILDVLPGTFPGKTPSSVPHR